MMRADDHTPKGILIGMRATFLRLMGNRDGIGAIEFAIIVPVLMLLYLMAFQITVALSMSKRASRAAGSIADLVTQKDTVKKADLVDMANVATSIFIPYPTTGMTLKITGITMDASANAKVKWSWSKAGTVPYAANSTVTVPSDIKKASTFLIRTELSIPFQLLLFSSTNAANSYSTITLSRTYYYRQRTDSEITCSDC